MSAQSEAMPQLVRTGRVVRWRWSWAIAILAVLAVIITWYLVEAGYAPVEDAENRPTHTLEVTLDDDPDAGTSAVIALLR